MSIKMQELMKELNLTEDQVKLMSNVQESFDSLYATEIEDQKKGLVTKNADLISRLKDAKALADKAEGIDLDGYNDYISNKDKIEADRLQAEEDALIASQNWDKLRNDMTNKHEATIVTAKEAADNTIASLRRALDHELIENVALKEIEKVEGSSTLLMPHIKDSIQTFQDESGKYITKVVDASGNDRMNAESGTPMKVSELIAEFQANDLFAGAFPIQNKGSGKEVTINGTKFNSTNNPFDKTGKNYSITEQAKLNKTNPALAKTLKAAVV